MKRLGADLINGHKTTNGHDVPGKNGRTPAADHFRHGHAIIEPGASVGAGTRIWAFAHVLAGAVAVSYTHLIWPSKSELARTCAGARSQ